MNTTITPLSVGTLKGYTLFFNSSRVQIVSDFGCNVNKLILNGQEVLEGNTTYKDLKAQTLARSSLLMPFPNRVNHGIYTFEGKKYHLDITKPDEGNAIHGLISDQPFTLIATEKTATFISATFQYTIDKKMFAGYPFDLSLVVKATLSHKTFSFDITATNIGAETLPYGVGWHPYLTTKKKINQSHFSIPSKEILAVNNILIPTGEVETITPVKSTLGERTFDTCFINLKSYKTTFDNITLFQDASMKYLQVYTPEKRTSIAVEPMSCAPDAYNNGMGLISLKPFDHITHCFGIVVN